MKALLCTHHFDTWSGSELVVLELAEALADKSWVVEFFAPFHKDDFLEKALAHRFHLHENPEHIPKNFDYDLVYVQHNTHASFLPLIDKSRLVGPQRPFFVFNHLSPYEKFEAPKTSSEATLADLILVNSPETASSLEHLGAPYLETNVVPNPAPKKFERARRTRTPGPLENLLVVSNHVPGELEDALNILKRGGTKIERVGLPADSRRLVPSDLQSADAILTIGKSVQYAIRARCPVYLYDRFAGPGWLTPTTMDAAEAVNFSGRDHQEPQGGDAIAKSLAQVPLEALAVSADCPARFKLEFWICRLLSLINKGHRKTNIHLNHQTLQIERMSVEHTDHFYSEFVRIRTAHTTLCQRYSELSKLTSSDKKVA